MSRLLILLLILFVLPGRVAAQDTLPKITVTQLGRRALVTWNNPYYQVTGINIQRSRDSLKYFTTIGSVLNVDPGVNGFTDPKEFFPNNQFYRLFISFEGGTYLFTESHRPEKDTMTSVPIFEKPPVTVISPKVPNQFVPSSHVYTGLDNNVIISLPDAATKKYVIKFYEEDGTFLFELKKIPLTHLTLDKVNFRHSGLFIFEIFENRIIVERHKFYIPRDGQPMPLMDRNGNIIR